MTEKSEIIWRTVSLVSFFFCVLVIISNLIIFPENEMHPHDLLSPKFVNIIDAATALVFLYLVFFPDNFTVYAILCPIHGFLNILDGGNIIGLMLFGLGGAFAFRAGLFRKNSQVTILALAVPLVTATLLQLRYGIPQFLHSMLYIFIMLIMYMLLFILFQPYLGELLPTIAPKQKIELSEYGLKERDLGFIQLTLNNEKYETISAKYNISLSAVKQRMGFIYRKLGAKDRNDFIRLFSQNEFLYTGMTATRKGDRETKVLPGPAYSHRSFHQRICNKKHQ